MNAVIPYLPQAAMAMRNKRKYSAAAKAAKFVYDNRETIGNAAKGVFRSMPKRKKGNPRAGRSAKATSTGFSALLSPSTINIKTLFTNVISFPPQGTTANGRTGFHIDLNGIKICTHLYNDATFPVEAHFALVRWRDREPGSYLDDFFTDTGGTGDRTLNYVSNDTYDIRQKCYPLNPQKWDILTHKRKIMGVRNANSSIKEADWFWKINQYFPINKTLEFETVTDVAPRFPFVYLIWYQAVDPADTPAGSQPGLVRHENFERVSFNNRN